MAEVTIRCRTCGSRGKIKVGYPDNWTETLETCDDCCGWGFELIEVEAVSS
ncbi:MAG TPA: hypothetical protein VMZ92_09000 [Planctomycetota bacterium]|nr:hypothetical protein [Planctomycetota bacterium]